MARTEIAPNLDTETVTIAGGASLSDAIALGKMVPVGVIVPAANWTTAALTFQGSIDGSVYINIKDDAGEYVTGSLANGEGCSLVKDVFRPWIYVKVRSGTSGAAVGQAGGDVLTLVLEAR